MSCLDTPRDVEVRGRDERFASYDKLVARADAVSAEIARIEREWIAIEPSSRAAWAAVAEQAEILHDLVAAMERWAADEDAELARDIEAARAAIRNLNTKPGSTDS